MDNSRHGRFTKTKDKPNREVEAKNIPSIKIAQPSHQTKWKKENQRKILKAVQVSQSKI